MSVDIECPNRFNSLPTLTLSEVSCSTDPGEFIQTVKGLTLYPSSRLLASEDEADFTFGPLVSPSHALSIVPPVVVGDCGMKEPTQVNGFTESYLDSDVHCLSDHSNLDLSHSVPVTMIHHCNGTTSGLMEQSGPSLSLGVGDTEVRGQSGHPSEAEVAGEEARYSRPLLSNGLSLEEVGTTTAKGSTLRPCQTQRHTPPLLTLELGDIRKLSDPAALLRREWMRASKSQRRQRCASDSEAPCGSMEEEENGSEGGVSALGYDSGYHDETKSKCHDSNSQFSQGVPDCEGMQGSSHKAPRRKATPHPLFLDPAEDYGHTPNPLTVAHRARRPFSKHHSVSSLGGTSSLATSTETSQSGSLLDPQSPQTATDILSSLGFDDFDHRQLVPDRFFPKDLVQFKPSTMRAQALGSGQTYVSPPSPESIASAPHPPSDPLDLPLGATADNFLESQHLPRVTSPPLIEASSSHPHLDTFFHHNAAIYTNPSISHFDRSKLTLETVPEETASDLSTSPRWISPRVSIDHTIEIDVAEGKLGTSLNLQKQRKRSLPQTQREGYKLSIGSQVESEGESIYLSVTSYDDEIAREREKEKEELLHSVPVPSEDIAHRRRRRGVYIPPVGLLSWLTTQQSICEEEYQDAEELPWPFNEQVKLRRSLTEIQQAQQEALAAAGETTLSGGPENELSGEAPPSPNSPGRPPSSPSSPGRPPSSLNSSERPPSPNRCSPHPQLDSDLLQVNASGNNNHDGPTLFGRILPANKVQSYEWMWQELDSSPNHQHLVLPT